MKNDHKGTGHSWQQVVICCFSSKEVFFGLNNDMYSKLYTSKALFYFQKFVNFPHCLQWKVLLLIFFRVFGLPADFKEGVVFSTYATLVSSVQKGTYQLLIHIFSIVSNINIMPLFSLFFLDWHSRVVYIVFDQYSTATLKNLGVRWSMSKLTCINCFWTFCSEVWWVNC